MLHPLRLLLAVLLLPIIAQAEESIVTVTSPRGADISQSYLWTPPTGTSAPKTIYLLFPGYPGVLNLRRNENGAIKFDLGTNFLIRCRRFRRRFAGRPVRRTTALRGRLPHLNRTGAGHRCRDR